MVKFQIQQVKVEKNETGSFYGKFVLESLIAGQGITIGNVLRRVILSELGKIAITGIRIPGVVSEFSIIPGLREDVLELILNLKGINLKSKIENPSPSFGKLIVRGPKIITADLLKLPPGIEIVNPKHYIATLSGSDILELEFKLEYGTGYKLANNPFLLESDNFLQLDAIFMPVQKADFSIETVYDYEDNIEERLFLEIWTDGSITPKQAIYESSNVIINIFQSIINNKIVKKVEVPKPELVPPPIFENNTNLAIEELYFSVRVYNCLKKANINTVNELLKYSISDLLALRNFGKKSAREVVSVIKKCFGIDLKKK